MRCAVLLLALTTCGAAVAGQSFDEAQMRKCGSEGWRMLHPTQGDGFAHETNAKPYRVIFCGTPMKPGRQRDLHIRIGKNYLAAHPKEPVIPPASVLYGGGL